MSTNLSQQAARLIHQQYGFRTDAESTQPIGGYEPKETLDYEINELGNEDIPDTLNRLYNTNFVPDSDGAYNIDAIDSFIKHRLHTEAYQLIWLVDEWQQCFELYAPNHITPKTP